MKSIYLSLALVTMTLSTGCMTTQALPDEQRSAQWGERIDTDSNFYQISPTVFRSEQPDILLIPQLKQHQITTIINLRHSNDDANILNIRPFNLVHIPIHTWQINRQDLLQVMQHIQQAQQRGEKVLIHCYHGSDRTGASIAMYRIIFENWTIEQAIQEMKQGGYGFHPIWQNIDRLFTEQNVQWIRQNLQ